MDPHNRYQRFGEEKHIIILPEIKQRILDRSARSLFSIPVGLL